MTKRAALAALLLLGFWNAPASARAITAANVADILTALQRAQPGDVITIVPGEYALPAIRLHHGGTKGHPIVLRAPRLGDVTLISKATEFFKVAASDWVFENLDIAGACTADTDCEHAFHIVGSADRVAIRHNRIRDFNAHVKGNGEGGRFPNDVRIENNWLFGMHVRRTDNPIATIDVVGGKRWIVRDNLIADYGKTFDHPATRSDDYGYALFFKGNSSGTLIERNVVLCADRLPHQPYTRGLSLGGSATGPEFCEGSCDKDENRDSTIRNNVVLACPGEPGIYLYRATHAQVSDNVLIGTGGIVAAAPDTSARVTNNALAGGDIVAQIGARLDLGHGVHGSSQPTAAPPTFAGQRIAAYRAYWDTLAKPKE
ncbi:MAG: hypothetical protein KGQ82_09000 [Alphaproteobacteria bacterium]|nr:hypothetical protein [Alphaproteobacteria bacterium]